MLYSKETMEGLLRKSLKFSKTFNGTEGEDFSAYNEAEKYLREKGFDLGSMQAGAPTAVARNADISKWRNISVEERNELDGVIVGASFRGLPVTVYLTEEPV